MTTTAAAPTATPAVHHSHAGAGACLVVGGLLLGLAANLGFLASDGLTDSDDKLRWGVDHAGVFRAEQLGTWAGALFLLVGFLGLARVTRARHPRLTAAMAPLLVAGMWGFSNSEALWYTVGSVAPDALGTAEALSLNKAFEGDLGVVLLVLLPLVVGQLFGFILLAVAGWQDLPRPAICLVLASLAWEMFLFDAVGGIGPFASESLLMAGAVWLGLSLIRRERP